MTEVVHPLPASLLKRDTARVSAEEDHALMFSILDVEGIAALEGSEWDRLAAGALVENPYYARQHVLAGIEALPSERDLRMLTIRARADGRLLGLFPFRSTTFSPLVPLHRATAALNLYQVSGTPLIDKERAGQVLAAFLGRAGRGGVPARWVFPHVDVSGEFALLAKRLAGVKGFAVLEVRGYGRPRLTRMEGGFAHHAEAVLGRKRVKEIERSLRRLRELGDLRFERASDPIWVRTRIEQFLDIEHSGWKGRQGTSFASHPDHETFAWLAYGGSPRAEGLASVDSLLLEGKPIAMSINIQTGATMFTPKCAFDESYRRYGPGLVLEYLVIEAFYKGQSCTEMDASTTTEGHIVSGFWNETKPMGTLVLGPEGWQTRLLAQIEETGQEAKKLARRLVRRG